MKILEQNGQFIGLRVEESFTLVPDSDTGWRPEVLRVTDSKEKTLLVYGGQCLQVEISSEGLFREKFLKYLSPYQVKILSALARDLTGKLSPIAGMAGYNLQKQVEKLGEKEIISALKNLYKGVEEVERGRKWLLRTPLIGNYLEEKIFPVTQF